MGVGYRLSRRRHRVIYDHDGIILVSEPGRKFLVGPGAPLQARPIDMGLPSGVQWASCNVGAARPSDFGLYFSWGNVDGHAVNEEYDFSQDVYDSTPAASIDTSLSLDQDAARANLGAPWRMPTNAEFKELYDNCTNVWTTMNGVNGLLFTSNVNGNTLFLPASGYFNSTSHNDRGSRGYYWSASYLSATNAVNLSFGSSDVNPQNSGYRRYGFSVRAVLQSA